MPNGIGLLYESTDTGAPELTPVEGSVQDLLKAVLVDGYGTKDPLGWTAPYYDAVSKTRVFRNSEAAGTGFFLQIKPFVTYSYIAEARVWEQMSAFNTGELPIHATDPSNYFHVIEYGRTTLHGAVPWKIIGDECGFWLMIQPYIDYTHPHLHWRNVYFGDYIPRKPNNLWNYCILAPWHYSKLGVSGLGQVGRMHSAYDCYRLARPFTFEPGSLKAPIVSGFDTNTTYTGIYTDIQYISGNDDAIQFSTPLYVLDSTTTYGGVMGRIPGWRNSITQGGIDGVGTVYETEVLKDYKVFDYGDYKEHFFPTIYSTTSLPGYQIITSGRRFRDVIL